MRFKRFIYSLLLVLFALVLLADLGLWFLVPETEAADGENGGFSFTPPEGFPEGMSLPEGVTLPEGFPEGMTLPEGMSLPEGGTFPGPGEGNEGSSRPRHDRSKSNEQTSSAEAADTAETEETGTIKAWFAAAKEWLSPVKTWLSARVEELRAYLPLEQLTPVKEMVAPYRLYIPIGAALGMVLCIIRLAFLNRKLRKLQEAQGDAASLKRVALWPAYLLLLCALGLVVFLFPGNEEEEAEDGAVANTQLMTGTVEEKTLTSLVQSAGFLEEQEAVSLEIPSSVTVSSVCVRNGDAVTAGQIVARVDRVSVMQAITSIQEVLETIDSQLQDAHEARSETSLNAPVTGTVKAVYAQVGKKAIDVMNEYGSLMLLSLDGRMAVDVPAGDDLLIGSGATVTLSSGKELSGEVAYLENGVATVTVVDRGYAIGEQVSVKTKAGVLLGSGPLYVHKPLNIEGYMGTVNRIYRREGTTAFAGYPVIGLSNTKDLADYENLLQQRSKYEEELQTLLALHETGYIHAPCDGVIDGLSDDLKYQSLSDMAASLTVRFVSTRFAENEEPSVSPEPSVSLTGTVVEILERSIIVRIGSERIEFFGNSSTTIYYTNEPYEVQKGDQIVIVEATSDNILLQAVITHPVQPTPSERPGGGSRPGGGFRIPSGGRSGSSGNSTPAPSYVIAKVEFCTVTPQEKMLITVPIDELDILSLSLGQEADLYLDALPSRGFTATVTKIDPEGENNGGNTKYSVTLSLDREAQLYPGMNGTVCFPRKGGKAVPTVALAALTEEGNRVIVYTAYAEETDELLSPVEVQTGVSDGTDVEILSGLALGDTYYYRFADSISYVTTTTTDGQG